MSRKDFESLLDKIFNKYKEVIEYGFKIQFIRGYKIIGVCNTCIKDKFLIQINLDYVEINSKEFVEHTILHEIAHTIDFINNGGWRINQKTKRIFLHDKEFKKICKKIGISGLAKPNYFINIPNKILKKFNPYKEIIGEFYVCNISEKND